MFIAKSDCDLLTISFFFWMGCLKYISLSLTVNFLKIFFNFIVMVMFLCKYLDSEV